MRNILVIGNTTTVQFVKEGSFRYVEQVCEGGTGIRFGGAYSAYIEAEAFYMSGAVTAVNEGDVIWYYQEFDVDNSFSPIDPPLRKLIGKFTVTKCIKGKKSYSFVAYDSMQKLNIDFSAELLSMKSQFPMHVSDFLDAISTFMSNRGVTVYVEEWYGYYAEDTSGEPVMLDYFYSNGITVRDILSYFANLTFQYIKCRPSGEIDFLFYSTDSRDQTGYWLNSDRYIIAPTDQQAYTGTYIDENTGLPVTGTLIPVFYKENGLKREGYSFAPCDGFRIIDISGDLIFGIVSQNPQNVYVVSDNIIASRINVPYDFVWDDIADVGFQNLVDMTVNHSVYPVEVHLFPFRNPYGAGCIIPHIADADGNIYQSVVMKMEQTDSEVVLTCSGPEYYYTDSSKNNDVAKTVASLAAELNNKVSKSGDTITGTLTLNHPLAIPSGGTGQSGLTTDTTISHIATAGSDCTITSASFSVFGKIAQFAINVTKSTAQTTVATVTMATLVSGKRPALTTGVMTNNANAVYAYVGSNGAINVRGTFTANQSVAVFATYLLP